MDGVVCIGITQLYLQYITFLPAGSTLEMTESTSVLSPLMEENLSTLTLFLSMFSVSLPE